ncbi:hypothetical protein PR048_017220 [Dryococelus australis]|uniref:Major facilitator superfamily (MFS) profile domain-containing protein n=1 Tax=Dryococelus australis TaxID=614101 RepID=A0ABQ9H944_9NEOP|nr:hypothetical protein PR048_017220 [Dryococelus australis]
MGAPFPALNAMISSWFPPDERQKLAGIMLSGEWHSSTRITQSTKNGSPPPHPRIFCEIVVCANTRISNGLCADSQGLNCAAGSIGVIASNSITGKLVDCLGWESTFYIMPTLLLAWSFLWWFFAYDTPELHPRISEEELAYIMTKNEKDQSQVSISYGHSMHRHRHV